LATTHRDIPGLRSPVKIGVDNLGVPNIQAQSFEDAIRAQGFLHATDRFFQMDLIRRRAAGELSEILGSSTINSDKRFRRFLFAERADQIINEISERERELLHVYTEGVNAGLAALENPPFEYQKLGLAPRPWRLRDCALVMLAMCEDLNSEIEVELSLGLMREKLPPELFTFLIQDSSRTEAPLSREGRTESYHPSPIPGPDVVNVRNHQVIESVSGILDTSREGIGSNNWVVSGRRSVHGGAILANDPHLSINAPVIWYRATLNFGSERVSGVSLPGVPGITIGATRDLAWGFTNTTGDFQDLVRIEIDPSDPSRYLTKEGSAPFIVRREEIAVRGEAPVELEVKRTEWGTVIGTDIATGSPVSLTWSVLERGGVNFKLLDMCVARDLEDGERVARTWRGPSQNILMAEDDGDIGWVVSGYIPDRFGMDGSVPASWRSGGAGWRGPIPEAKRPAIINPEDGVLYTANNRTLDTNTAKIIGNNWSLANRAARIEELLRAQERFSESDLQKMQLDTRVTLLDFYRELALKAVGENQNDPVLCEAARLITEWDGTAEVGQSGIPILDTFRAHIHEALLSPLLAPCRAADPNFRLRWQRIEEPMRRLIEERPIHLLPPQYESWDVFLVEALRNSIDELTRRYPDTGVKTTWGETNRAAIAHPLARAFPDLKDLLSMPPDPLPGHTKSIRATSPDFGSSMRMVVSPGHEDLSLLHMPTGQSGDPTRATFRNSHAAWVEGAATPMRPGDPVSEIILRPLGSSD
jgi:penicillin amidase